MGIDTAIGQEQGQRHGADPVGPKGPEVEIFLFAGVDVDLDRIDRGHRGQFLLHGRTDQVAQLGLGDAGDAVHRRGDAGETEIEFRLVEIGGGHGHPGPGGLDPGPGRQLPADGIVQVLFRDRVLGRQRPHPGQVGAGGEGHGLLPGEVTFGLVQGGAGLVDRGLEGAGIDLEQHLAFAHQVALPVLLAQQVAAHLRPDDRVDRAVEHAHPFAVQGHVPLGHPHHLDHRHGRGCGLVLLAAAGEGQHQEKRHNQKQACRLSPPGGSCACQVLSFHQVPPPDPCCWVLLAVAAHCRTAGGKPLPAPPKWTTLLHAVGHTEEFVDPGQHPARPMRPHPLPARFPD